MKLKTKILLASAVLGLTLSQANAQTAIPLGQTALLAGWDFNNISTSTITSTNARYSDVWGDTTASPFTVAAGSFAVNGTGGSDTWPNITRTGSGDVDRSIIGRPGTSMLGTLAGADGSLSATGTIGEARNEFALNLHSATSFNNFEDLSLSYYARNSGTAGNLTIDWFYSIDGGASKVATGIQNVVSGSSFANYTADFSAIAALEGLANFSLIGLLAETDVNATLQIDNLAVYGVGAVAIPEPSTYAAVLGVLALGVAALRRRRGQVIA